MLRMDLTEDTARVIAVACDAVPLSKTRDAMIAHQVAGAIRHALMPDAPAPMRWADEPYPVCPKHGRWVYGEKSDAYDIYGVKTWALAGTCSECGFTHKFIEAHTCYAFCPACGARLEG